MLDYLLDQSLNSVQGGFTDGYTYTFCLLTPLQHSPHLSSWFKHGWPHSTSCWLALVGALVDWAVGHVSIARKTIEVFCQRADKTALQIAGSG